MPWRGAIRIVLTEDGGQLTTSGAQLLDKFGIDLPALKRRRRIFCRPCLDWSEGRPHLAGSVGAALAARCFELGWIERLRDTRAIAISPAGRRGFAETFGIEQIDAKGLSFKELALDGVAQDPQKWMRRTIGEARGAVDQCRACSARPGGGKVTNWLAANRGLRDETFDRMLSI
jgi:hypothetical protein